MNRVVFAVIALLLLHASQARAGRVLRVCADPNNLPFSSDKTPGFENEIADVIAHELGATVQYVWWAQRRGFFRNTLKAKDCDVVIGVPAGLDLARTTAPYYRSAYAIVTRADRHLDITSLDDPRLKTLTIGVQLTNDDSINPPPSHALARRGIIDNVRGFNVTGDYTHGAPAAEVLRALVDGKIDVAVAWGPLAGGFARLSGAKLVITPLTARELMPMVFDIAVGVRHPDKELASEIDRALARGAVDIAKILARWQIPLVEATKS